MSTSTQMTVTPAREMQAIGQQPAAIFDLERLKAAKEIAQIMSEASLCPEALRCRTDDTNNKIALPASQVFANCFMVVEQSLEWGVSPFAAAQVVSVVHGKLMWEGKFVAALIEKFTGLRLHYDITGQAEAMTVRVWAKYPDEQDARAVNGSVSAWKTNGKGSPWTPANYERQLRYRGAREWARAHSPGVIVGVLADGDDLDFEQVLRDEPARPARRLSTDLPAGPKTEKAAQSKKTPVEQLEPHDAETGEIIDDDVDQRPPQERAQSAYAEALHDAQDWKAIEKAILDLSAAYAATNVKPENAEITAVRVAAWRRWVELQRETPDEEPVVPWPEITNNATLFACFVEAVESIESLKALFNSYKSGEMYAALSIAAKNAIRKAVDAKLLALETPAA